MYRTYNSAPLPFIGQKRRFVKAFKAVLHQFENIETVVDLFGGSGLLSHVAKRERPELRVIYNDYDNYCRRIENVGTTNEILNRLREMLAIVPVDKHVPENLRREILEMIRSYESKCFVDYLTLGNSLLFSGKWAKDFVELSKHPFYNRTRLTDYETAGYLDGLEVTHEDYKTLFAKYKDKDNVLFLIDPPYLSTQVGSYACYWKLRDYLDVLNLLNGTQYIYFTSDKSQIIELCEWIKDNPELRDPFAGAEILTQNNRLNYQAAFTDIMLVKR